MSTGMILGSVAMAVSFVVAALRVFDWVVTADPRAVVRTGRRLLWILAALAVPGLLALLALREWAGAMLVGAALVGAVSLALPAALNRRRPAAAEAAWRGRLDALRGDFGQPPPDPELVRRAAIVLEDYLVHAGHGDVADRIDGRADDVAAAAAAPWERMDREEALEVLGLRAGAKPPEIRAAHRRLVGLVHPDRGGTNYLAAKINRAKDVLLARAPRRARAIAGTPGTAAAARERVGDPG